jgi:hypothetical protein
VSYAEGGRPNRRFDSLNAIQPSTIGNPGRRHTVYSGEVTMSLTTSGTGPRMRVQVDGLEAHLLR